MQPVLRAMLYALIATTTLATGGYVHAQTVGKEEMAPSDRALGQLYWQGHEALKDADWSGAIEHFSDLEKQLRAKEPSSADVAVYWQAYALIQAKRTTEAKAAVERLHRDFPSSRWNKAADALLRQTQAVATQNAGATDEDVADAAVEGLLGAPPERALPILKKVLASAHSDKVKKRALFVLSQIGNDAALDAIVDLARNGSDPQLRDEAIRMLGISGQDRAIARLRDVYAHATGADERRSIVQAWLIAGRKDLILDAARSDSDAGVRAKAIELLGAMNASAELKQVLDATQDASAQRTIVRALGVSGDVQTLSAVAASQRSDEIRSEALRGLGIAGDKGGAAALVAIYPTLTTPRLRQGALEGLLIARNSDGVVRLYRHAQSKEEKQALLRTLTLIGDGAAVDLIESELDKSGGSHE